ncbi:MAG: hypothetical protein R3301_16240 [Saprospiraceae bacterium]|nr:hypothetical protein [Saprospiraceae bacterium]
MSDLEKRIAELEHITKELKRYLPQDYGQHIKFVIDQPAPEPEQRIVTPVQVERGRELLHQTRQGEFVTYTLINRMRDFIAELVGEK